VRAGRGAWGLRAGPAAGRDSTTGHGDLRGIALDPPLPPSPPGSPPDLVPRCEPAIGRGTLGNYPASGTVIIQDLGEEHVRTGKPILYTSADSVLQLAAHEEVIPLEELYHMCGIARGMLTGEHAVGRIIARPFIGTPGHFVRTPNRRDFSLPPPAPTLLDTMKDAGYEVRGVGKIEDLFAHRGLTWSNHTGTNEAGMAVALEQLDQPFPGLLFVNLVDCDQLYGHRRNPRGYALALEQVDAWLPQLLARLRSRDALFITGDHGTDPTYMGTDHTREAVPLLAVGDPITPNV